MLRLRPASLVAILGVALAAAACGGSSPIAASETFAQKVESYTGVLNPGGERAAFHFSVANPGSLDASVTRFNPAFAGTFGLNMGYWDAVTETCPQQGSTEVARVNLAFSINPPGPGEYCVAIYDIGNLPLATEFDMSVLHY